MLILESLLATLAGGLSLLMLFRRIRASRPSLTPKSVALVVLGDIGRSPRMLYHAHSFARHGYTTHIVAYRGQLPLLAPPPFPPDVVLTCSPPPRYRLEPARGPRRRPARPLHLPRDARRLGQHPPAAPLRPPPPAQGRRRRMVPLARPHRHPGRARLPLRPGTSTLRYLATCDRRADASPARPQNPPAIPTLAIVKVAALVRGSRVIVDWHNTGYSVLALRLGERHPVVRLAKLCVPLSLSPSRSHELALTYLGTATASSSCSVGQHTRTCACRMP